MQKIVLNREDVLNYDKLFKILEKTEDKDKIPVIADLKQQVKMYGLSVRDFNEQIKKVNTELARKSMEIKNPVAVNGQDIYAACIVDYGKNQYSVTENGIYTYIGTECIEVCSHPIYPVEILTDIETGEEKIKIAFKKCNKWSNDIVVDRLTIATTKNIIKLASLGIMVNDNNARLLVKYFADMEKYNELYIPRKMTTSRLGWTEYGFVPYVDNIEYSGNSAQNERTFKLFHVKGSEEEWLKISVEVFDHTIPKIMIAGGYASLLTEIFNLNPFCIHLWGASGYGKSVSILASAATFGYPDIKTGIVRTGNTTSNGIEPMLNFFKNVPLYLDELTTKTPQEIQQLIYTHAQGQGKGRMTRNGTGQMTNTWNNVLITNAEFPIATSRSKAGQIMRILQIFNNKPMFDDMDLPTVANKFLNNYGFGAKKFIEIISDENVKDEILTLRKDYFNQLIHNTEEKQANAMSIVLTAFEIARKYIYKTDKKLTASEVREYLASKEDINQVKRAYNDFIDYVNANYIYFDDSDIRQAKYGCFSKDKKVVNIFNAKFVEFCDKIGIDEKQFKLGLKDMGKLIHRPDSLTNRVRFNNETMAMVSIEVNDVIVELTEEEAKEVNDIFSDVK